MGKLLKANCSNCGYESGLLRVEAGRRNWESYFGVPAHCYSEHAVVVVNLKAPHSSTATVEKTSVVPGPGFLHEVGSASARQSSDDSYLDDPLLLEEAGPDAYNTPGTDAPQSYEELADELAASRYGAEIIPSADTEGTFETEEWDEAPAALIDSSQVSAPADEDEDELWPTDRAHDPGPASGVDEDEDLEPGDLFPADQTADPGPATGHQSHSSAPDAATKGEGMPRGPWKLGDAERKEKPRIPAMGRTIAAPRGALAGLVATPVEPRNTMPLTASSDHSQAEDRSRQIAGGDTGDAPIVPAGSVAAYPCPNDDSATTLYEFQPEDLTKTQSCPNCGAEALLFSLEGRWD